MTWLASLPSPAIYAVLAVLAAVENLLPPVPADTAVALGAFLSARGVLSPGGVFAVTVLSNLAGAAAVYQLARGPGRRWFSTPTGRKLLSPRALSVLEREYIRLGTVGIFLVRLLPGIRAAVPPFAGLTGIGPVRTLVPVTLAAALWYGGITWLGTMLGLNWDRISGLVGEVNTTLAIVGMGAVLVLVLGIRRRLRANRQALWDGVAAAVTSATASGPEHSVEAVAPIVLELVCADEALGEAERDQVAARLRRRWRVPAFWSGRQFDDLLAQGDRLQREYSHEERLALARRMLDMLRQDGELDVPERRMLQRAGRLLGLGAPELEALGHGPGKPDAP